MDKNAIIMANEQNLEGHGFGEQTASEQREIARAGGIASGEARRRKRTLRQIAEMLAEKNVNITNPDGTREQVTMDVALVQRQYQKAVMDGDTTAAKFIGELLGELKTNIGIEGGGLNVIVRSEEEAEKIRNIGKLGI